VVEDRPIKVSSIVIIGVVSALILLVIVIGLQAWYYYEENLEQTRKTGNVVMWDLANLRLEQQEKINSYRWVDQNTQVATIPIDRAIELSATRLSAGGKP